MDLDLRGRLRNMPLRRSQALLPVFEAVINSIQAIASSPRRKSGIINIRVTRQSAEVVRDLVDRDEDPPTAFEITDNGCGFDEVNFKSFRTSDTLAKSALGGRGIGRLLWLIAFDRVEVVSTFEDAGKALRRSFRFLPTATGVEGHEVGPAPKGAPITTTVLLSGLKKEWQEYCPKRLKTIGQRLIEHCLSYFIHSDCPTINLWDGDEKLNLNSLYEELFEETAVETKVAVRGHRFRVLQLRLYGAEQNHRLHFCANDRDVQSENLGSQIPNLTGRIRDQNDRQFFWTAYVFGDYLDSHVHPERAGFTIPQDSTDSDLTPDELSFAEIREAILPVVEDALKPFLEPIQLEKEERIRKYVTEEAPEYRALLKHAPELIHGIPPGLTDNSLEAELHKVRRTWELELRKEGAELMDCEGSDALPGEFVEKLIGVNQSNLARYVAGRRQVLDLLSKSLARGADGRYSREDRVHQVIFPMRQTSDDAPDHNLWVVDERLAYHGYLASDLPLSEHQVLDSTSRLRPDVIVYNCPHAVREENAAFSSIVILEFKRPARKDYPEDDNPITQVYGYIKTIREGKAKDKNGRPIVVSDAIPFYCYILCDLEPKIRQHAEYASLKQMPDQMGYFGYNENLKAWVEVVAYDKMLSDAKKRNRAFFDRLGLHTS